MYELYDVMYKTLTNAHVCQLLLLWWLNTGGNNLREEGCVLAHSFREPSPPQWGRVW